MRFMGLGLKKRRLEEVVDTSRAEMLAVWIVAARRENDTMNLVIQTDRKAIAKRYRQSRVTNNIEA